MGVDELTKENKKQHKRPTLMRNIYLSRELHRTALYEYRSPDTTSSVYIRWVHDSATVAEGIVDDDEL